MLVRKISVIDRNGKLVEEDFATGNTSCTLEVATAALIRCMENQYGDSFTVEASPGFTRE